MQRSTKIKGIHDVDPKIILIGERLTNRTFNGANKALPVLTSALNNVGFHNVRQMDLENPGCSIEDVLRETVDADLVGISGLSTQLDDIDTHASQIYRNLRKITPIIVGGYAAKSIREVALASPHITAFFNGEGEEGIVQIARSVAQGTFEEDKPSILGLCYVDSEGVYHESVAERVRALDTDQNFDFQHIPEIHDMDVFKDENGRQLKTAQLFTQRGCAFRCGYCNKSREENFIVYMNLERLEEQVISLVENGFEAVYLDDDTATTNQKRFRSNIEMIAKYGLKIGLNTRIDIEARRIRKGDSDIRFAKEHEVVYEFFGVEHTDSGVLMAIGKFNGSQQMEKARQYADDVKLVFKEMGKCGVPSSYFLILGLPKLDGKEYRATSIDEDKEAIRFALEECNPDYFNFNILRFMPGSIAADKIGKNHPFYCVRPTGGDPVTGAYFLTRLNPERQEHNLVFRCFESLTPDQARSTAVTPERAYETLRYAIDLINQRIDEGKKTTRLFLDQGILDRGLITQSPNGKYGIGQFERFL